MVKCIWYLHVLYVFSCICFRMIAVLEVCRSQILDRRHFNNTRPKFNFQRPKFDMCGTSDRISRILLTYPKFYDYVHDVIDNEVDTYDEWGLEHNYASLNSSQEYDKPIENPKKKRRTESILYCNIVEEVNELLSKGNCDAALRLLCSCDSVKIQRSIQRQFTQMLSSEMSTFCKSKTNHPFTHKLSVNTLERFD